MRFIVRAPKVCFIFHAPKVRFIVHAPKVRFIFHAPKVRFIFHAPKVRFIVHAPKVRFIFHAPKVLHCSCAKGAIHFSCTEGVLHCSCTEGALHCSCTEGALHVPQGTLSFKTGGVSNCGRLGRCISAYVVVCGRCIVHRLCSITCKLPCLATLCDRHRASLHDPQVAGSPTHTAVPKSEDRTLWVRSSLFGAGGGGRTRTVLLPTDFESVTSANSITPAYIM